MKIIIINSSHRKNGATSYLLNQMYLQLNRKPEIDVQFYHVADLSLTYCIGCCTCYETGSCMFNDDIEKLSQSIEKADGIIIGTPTYASNLSGQLKTIIDRGHFVMEQLLHGKYALNVVTYEHYGGKDTLNILHKLVSYSGANISGNILLKTPFSTNTNLSMKTEKMIQKATDRIYHDIKTKHNYHVQTWKRSIIFHLGIRPFVSSKGQAYEGVLRRWKHKHIKY